MPCSLPLLLYLGCLLGIALFPIRSRRDIARSIELVLVCLRLIKIRNSSSIQGIHDSNHYTYKRITESTTLRCRDEAWACRGFACRKCIFMTLERIKKGGKNICNVMIKMGLFKMLNKSLMVHMSAKIYNWKILKLYIFRIISITALPKK